MGRSTPPLPLDAQRALRTLGANIRDARRRRRLTLAIVAERAMVSYVTALKAERGEPAVSVGAYASILFVLGLVDALGELAAIEHDQVGQQLASDALPKRVRLRRSPATTTPRRRKA